MREHRPYETGPGRMIGSTIVIGSTMKDRRGVTLIELLVVVLIVSVLAAIAQPQLASVIVKARAAEAISDLEIVRGALYTYQSDQKAWPPEVNGGVVPPGLATYLPAGFDFEKETYTLDFDNWGGSPFMIGVTLITADSVLGRRALEMLSTPKWSAGDKYTWVIE